MFGNLLAGSVLMSGNIATQKPALYTTCKALVHTQSAARPTMREILFHTLKVCRCTHAWRCCTECASPMVRWSDGDFAAHRNVGGSERLVDQKLLPLQGVLQHLVPRERPVVNSYSMNLSSTGSVNHG